MNKKFLSAILFGALAIASTGSFVSCKDYDDDIDSLQSQITNLSSVKGEISTVQSSLQGEIAAAKAAADAAKAAADKAATTADVKAAADEAAKAAVEAAKADLLAAANEKLAEAMAGTVSEDQVKAAIAEAIGAIEGCKCDVDAAVTAAVAALKTELNIDGKFETVNKALEAQSKALENYAKMADVNGAVAEAIKSCVKTDDLNAEIKKINAEIAKVAGSTDLSKAIEDAKTEIGKSAAAINENLNMMAPVRLSSAVFAPTTYINGIEAIKFENLKYEGWKTVKQDAPDEAKYYALPNEGATAEYYVSPENTALKSIKSVSFLSNVATNTRAVAAAKISSDIAKAKIENGKLILKLKKDDAADWGTPSTSCNSKEEFPIVALKAVLADEVLTAKEKEAKTEVAVFSDWARVIETTATPIIDNETVKTHAVKGTAWDYKTSRSDAANAAHFWNYSTVYPKAEHLGETKANPNTTDAKLYIAAHATYKEPIDLDKLTQVCTWSLNGTKKELNADPKADNYGLKFRYTLVDYFYKNQDATQDATNQKLFGTIEEGHMLYATSENGLKNNADAVGRTPLVRAELLDGEKVVDVVYFKVQWDEIVVPATYMVAATAEVGPANFTCAPGLYDQWIGEKFMNDLYASMLDNKGMTRTQFHEAFPNILTKKPLEAKDYAWTATPGKVQGDLYLGKVTDAAKAAVATGNMKGFQVVGYVTDLSDDKELTSTHNIEIKAAAEAVNPAKEADFTTDAFFAYKGGESYVIIPVTITVKAGKFAYKFNYLESQWEENGGQLVVENTAKARPVNPTLYSDGLYGNDAKFQIAPESKPGTLYPVAPAKDVTKGFGTTQLVGNLTYGYMLKSQNPKTIEELVNYTPATGAAVDKASDIVFDSERLGEVASQTGTKVADWSLSANNKTLYYTAAGKKIAASEIKDNLIYLVDNTDPLDVTKSTGTTGDLYAEPTAPALMLVGKYVPVKVTTGNCAPINFDKYVVRFITPLEISLKAGGIELKDILNDGDAESVTLSDKYTLKEAFGSKTEIKLFGGSAMDKTLIAWYEIKNIEVDLSKATINIDENGKMVTDEKDFSKLSDLKNSSNLQLYVLKTVKNTGTKDAPVWVATSVPAEIEGLQFHNNSGQAITKDLIIKLPVSMDTKWQKGLNEKITVIVHPNL